ncbi:MAG: right-handed parallel beta-helix repeat-containing protein [Tannerellaceae bacterium]|nr:right-handed parallel beta-helix repeat-containing protein [Tannerellaceae bacterium]
MKVKLLLLSLASSFFCGTAYASTYFVSLDGNDGNIGLSDDKPLQTLGKALELVLPGDAIHILTSGEYTLPKSKASFHITHNLTIIGKAEGVRLVGNELNRVLLIHGERGDMPISVHLENLIVEGGLADTTDTVHFGSLSYLIESGQGGGIYNRFARTTLKNVTVRNNTGADVAIGFGGGIYNADSSSLTLESDVYIMDNIASRGQAAGSGGGIYNLGQLTIAKSEGTVVVSGNCAVGNKLSSATGLGGGLVNDRNGKVTVSGTLDVRHNTATVGTGAGKGGGIAVLSGGLFDIEETEKSHLIVTGNIAVGNPGGFSSGAGGGIYVNADEGAGLADLRINYTIRDSMVQITDNCATVGLGNGKGGGIFIGGDGRVIFAGSTYILHNYAINNPKSSGTGSGGGLYRDTEEGTSIAIGTAAPLIMDNVVTNGTGGGLQPFGMWTITLLKGTGIADAPNTTVYEVIASPFDLALKMDKGFHIATPQLYGRDTTFTSSYFSEVDTSYHFDIEAIPGVANMELSAQTSTRAIVFISNSPGLSFYPGGTGKVMVDAGKPFNFSVRKTAEKYRATRIVSVHTVDGKELPRSAVEADSFAFHYAFPLPAYDTIWADLDVCRIVLEPAKDGTLYVDKSQLWEEEEGDSTCLVTYMASGKTFQLKVKSETTPQVLANDLLLQPQERNTAANTYTYFYTVPKDTDSVRIVSYLYRVQDIDVQLSPGLELIPFGTGHYIMNTGRQQVSGNFQISVKVLNPLGVQDVDVFAEADGIEVVYLGKDHAKKEYYFSVLVSKMTTRVIPIYVGYKSIARVTFDDPEDIYGTLSVDLLPQFDGDYYLSLGDILRFTVDVDDDLQPLVKAISQHGETIFIAPVSWGKYTYTYDFPITDIDTFHIHIVKEPNIALSLLFPPELTLLGNHIGKDIDGGYKMNIVHGGEYTISFKAGAYYRLAQPLIRVRGDEEFPSIGDTISFVLRNLTNDTEVEVDFGELNHIISFSVTDPDIRITAETSMFAIARGSDYAFIIDLPGGTPIVIVNGQAVTSSVQSDGTYKVVLSNISQDMEISIHEAAPSPTPPTAAVSVLRPEIKVAVLSGGILQVESATPVPVTVYTLTGRIQAHVQVNGAVRLPLSRGIYLVKTGTEIRKVVCR